MKSRKALASMCVAALAMSSPGLGCYEAAARMIAAAPAAQAGLAGRVGSAGSVVSAVGTAAPLAGLAAVNSGALSMPVLPGLALPSLRTGPGPAAPAVLSRSALPLPVSRSAALVRPARAALLTRESPRPTLKARLSGLVGGFRTARARPGSDPAKSASRRFASLGSFWDGSHLTGGGGAVPVSAPASSFLKRGPGLAPAGSVASAVSAGAVPAAVKTPVLGGIFQRFHEAAPWLKTVVLGNTAEAWLTAGVSYVAVLAALYLLKKVVHGAVRRVASRTKNKFDNLLADLLGGIKTRDLHVAALYAGVQALTLGEKLAGFTQGAFLAYLFYRLARLTQAAIDFGFEQLAERMKERDPRAAEALMSVSKVVRLLVWPVAVLAFLPTVGINVTGLVAGLGVGGIAVALAAQSILKDLFSYVLIHLDRPFMIGDFIVLDDGKMGTVERVGIRSTLIRGLGGEVIIVPNTDLTASRISNYKLMERRRIPLKFKVSRDATREQLARIPALVQGVVEGLDDVTFDRAHLSDLGDNGYEFEVIYFVEKPDYVLFRDRHQAILHGLLEGLEKEGVEISFPFYRIYPSIPRG